MSANFSVKIMTSRKVTESIIAAISAEEARLLGSKLGQVLSVKKLRGGSRFDRMSLADRLILFQRLSSMLGAKLGTSEALDVIYHSFTGVVKDAARLLRDRVGAGGTLPDAMAFAGPRYFPASVVAIVRTGSRGGDMAYALKEAGRFEKELDQVKRQSSKGIWGAVMGFLTGVATILGSTLYVAPQVLGSSLVTSSGGGVNVGWVLTMAYSVSAFAVFLTVVAGCIFLYAVVLHPLAPAAIDRGILKIPFYRDMAMAKNNYMVFFGLGVLLKAGLRVEEALQLTIESSPKGELRDDLGRAMDAIVKGSSEPWPNKMRMLHPTDRAALSTAQDRTQIASTIQDLALQYQSIYHSRMELFVPALTLMSAIFLSLAGFVLFGVSVLPLLQSTSAILGKL